MTCKKYCIGYNSRRKRGMKVGMQYSGSIMHLPMSFIDCLTIEKDGASGLSGHQWCSNRLDQFGIGIQCKAKQGRWVKVRKGNGFRIGHKTIAKDYTLL